MQRVRIYTPFLATVVVVLIVGSMMGANVEVVKQSGWQIISAVFTLHCRCGVVWLNAWPGIPQGVALPGGKPRCRLRGSGTLIHCNPWCMCSGFALGYYISKALKLSEKICRTNSIEVRGLAW